MIQKTMYECGCMAAGDNVASSCPIHGDPILKMCSRADACAISEIFGGFPTCYDPRDKIIEGCPSRCTVYTPIL